MVGEVGRDQDRQVSGMSTEQSFIEVPGLEGCHSGSVRSGADREIQSTQKYGLCSISSKHTWLCPENEENILPSRLCTQMRPRRGRDGSEASLKTGSRVH